MRHIFDPSETGSHNPAGLWDDVGGGGGGDLPKIMGRQIYLPGPQGEMDAVNVVLVPKDRPKEPLQEKEFAEALAAIEDTGGPLLAAERIQQTITSLDPVSALREQTATITNQFTADGHDMAHDSTISGAIQSQDRHGQSQLATRDIGWHSPTADIPDPLIEGISNGKLFSIIRRFNKDVFAVSSVPPSITQGRLDLEESWSDEYASDKITLNLQRLYLNTVLELASFGKQVSRLRSWKETPRTSVFCAMYSVAWYFDLLTPLMLGTLMLVITSKESRDLLFPPAPRALVNMSTGGLQQPASGQLGTLDSLTGASEKQQGEAVEEEAANFVHNVRHLVQRAVGMHEKERGDGDPLEGKVPKPVRKAVRAIKAKGTNEGHATEEDDQTQGPMENILWDKASPEKLAKVMKIAPHVVGEFVDNWERFANAISPTPPFSKYSFLRIDAVVLPIFLSAFFISSYMVYKAAGLAVGFGIFGDPVLTPALQWLNRTYPNWLELVQPKNNILRGVPTNKQLALTLLRIGEVYNTPLPPVPSSKADDKDQIQDIDVENIPIEASEAQKLSAIQESPLDALHRQEKESEPEPQPKHKRLSKITRIFKSNTKASVETKLAVDHVRAAAGSEKAKGHLGVLPKPKNLIYAGPSHFKARFDGKQGWLYITEGPKPILLYTTKDPRSESVQVEDLDPVVALDVRSIQQLKRATAFANKPAEMAAGWSSEKELLGSVEIQDLSGKEWRFTALPERDELFNRLVAIGAQRWENL
ncbi:hypothetical protein MBM_02075 [Drepanopeziza brunnea f. sp. 'multigermtubi' MB_m1]|uniref:Proteasome subunit beta type protein n=1 Tax=Marssonina brunnea f. sp. multigermtubi (strain MB_m1) TaxID=1072389 RepID=K1XH88_MARBU|nr:uncharacterized protein MBM_02075 [Drepanopeziza brunnea f. sp. 'multigermtubi' MB_m1]EKD20123.1 hypothetical protein MBM_02075 [Drepanopeziza brunnea f. sp. 'multigermtubi' MB_m1]